MFSLSTKPSVCVEAGHFFFLSSCIILPLRLPGWWRTHQYCMLTISSHCLTSTSVLSLFRLKLRHACGVSFPELACGHLLTLVSECKNHLNSYIGESATEEGRGG